jgi:hypothetical protein
MPEIEILRAGRWVSANGSPVDISDEVLDQVVESYDPENFKAPLIVSHSTGGEDDKSLAETELAYGFPSKLKKVGDRVRAVFDNIAPQFTQWNRDGQLLSVSSSLYPPVAASNPTPGKWSLRHIAGLGINPPAIKGLAPLALNEDPSGDDWAYNLNEFDLGEQDNCVDVEFQIHRELTEIGAGNTETVQNPPDTGEIDMSEQEKQELEQLRQEREQLKSEVAHARMQSIVSFCEQHASRFTPAMQKEQSIEFGETTEKMDAVTFMASLDGKQLAWFKGMVKELPEVVEMGEVAGEDSDPGNGDVSFNEMMETARKKLQESYNKAAGVE